MLGEHVEAVESSTSPSGDLLCLRQTFVPLQGALWFGLSQSDAALVGQSLLAAAGLADDSTETRIRTFGEILAQASGALASDYSAKLRRDVRTAPPQIGTEAKPEVAAEFALKVTAGTHIFPMTVTIEGTDLLSPLAPSETPSAALAPRTAERFGSGTDLLEGVNTKNLDLLLDVEMPVSVSFGRAHLALKDVIKLTTGSIVELNRAVSEPVDIIVNNCVIARGEVVVVEGNFGVRVKQIVSKQERLKSVT